MDCKTCLARHFSAYAAASGEQIERIRELRAEMQCFRSGQVIADDRTETAQVCTLQQGWAYSYVLLADGRSQILAFHHAGDLITGAALLDGHDHAIVRALTDVVVCRFPRDDLRSLIDSAPELRRGLDRYLARKLRDCALHNVALGAMSAEEAMAALILSLARRAEERGEAADLITFPLKLRHMADALGITEVHAGRVFRHLQATGAVAREAAGRLRIDRNRLTDHLRGAGTTLAEA